MNSGLVITMPDGSPVTPNRFSIWFKKHMDRLGLPTIRLHDGRHSYAVALILAGVPLKVISERMGHASVAFTMDVDGHVIEAWMPTQPTGERP